MARNVLAILLTLAAAAAAPAPGRASAARTEASDPAPHKSAPPRPAPSKPAAPKAGETPRAAPPKTTAASLVGLTEAEARTKLGAPDAVNAEGRGAMWTYRLDDCALFVFFKAEDDKPLKVSGTASGARRRGEATLSVDRCLAEALVRAKPIY